MMERYEELVQNLGFAHRHFEPDGGSIDRLVDQGPVSCEDGASPDQSGNQTGF